MHLDHKELYSIFFANGDLRNSTYSAQFQTAPGPRVTDVTMNGGNGKEANVDSTLVRSAESGAMNLMPIRDVLASPELTSLDSFTRKEDGIELFVVQVTLANKNAPGPRTDIEWHFDLENDCCRMVRRSPFANLRTR